MLRRSLVCVFIGALFSIAPHAHAQDAYFPDDTTINYFVPERSSNVGRGGGSQTSPTVNLVNGGSVDVLNVYNSSVVNISGGQVRDSLLAYDSSVINLSGGNVVNHLYGFADSTLNIFGSNLTAPLDNPNVSGAYSRYLLSGTLLDGTVVTNKYLYIRNGDSARFTLNAVPAPSALAAFVIGAVPGAMMVLRRRRKA